MRALLPYNGCCFLKIYAQLVQWFKVEKKKETIRIPLKLVNYYTHRYVWYGILLPEYSD